MNFIVALSSCPFTSAQDGTAGFLASRNLGLGNAGFLQSRILEKDEANSFSVEDMICQNGSRNALEEECRYAADEMNLSYDMQLNGRYQVPTGCSVRKADRTVFYNIQKSPGKINEANGTFEKLCRNSFFHLTDDMICQNGSRIAVEEECRYAADEMNFTYDMQLNGRYQVPFGCSVRIADRTVFYNIQKSPGKINEANGTFDMVCRNICGPDFVAVQEGHPRTMCDKKDQECAQQAVRKHFPLARTSVECAQLLATHPDFDRSTFKQRLEDDRKHDQCYLFKKGPGNYQAKEHYTTCKEHVV